MCGGAGFFGTNLVARLSELPEIDVVGTYFSKLPSASLTNTKFRRVDLADFQQTLDITADFDVVVMAAVMSPVTTDIGRSAVLSNAYNIKMVSNVGQACDINRVGKLIWLSSATVYQQIFGIASELDLDLNAKPARPTEQVGWYYRYAEQILLSNGALTHTQLCILRVSSMYGPHDNFSNTATVVPALLKKALSHPDKLFVRGDGKAARDFVFVSDVVAVVEEFINNCFEDRCVVNVGSGRTTSIRELVISIIGLLGVNMPVEFEFDSDQSAMTRSIDITKLDQLTDGLRKTELLAGLAKTMSWYQAVKEAGGVK